MKKNTLIYLLYALGTYGFILMSSIPSFLGIVSTPFSIAIRTFVVLLSVIVLVNSKFKKKYNLEFILFIAFTTLYSLRVAHAYYFNHNNEIVSFMSNMNFLLFLYLTCVIPSFALFFGFSQNAIDYKKLTKISFNVILTATSLVIINSYMRGIDISLEIESLSRLSTNAVNPIAMGHIGVSLILVSIVKLNNNEDRKYITILGLIIGISSLIMSSSKGPIISIFIVILIYMASQKKFKNLSKNIFYFFAIIVLGYSLIIFFEDSFGVSLISRFSKIGSDASVLGRIELYDNTIKQFINSPVIGSALIEKVSGYYPHNVILESLISTGIFGGLLFIIILIKTLLNAIFIIKHRHDISWIGLIAIQYIVGFMFSGSLFAGYNLWLSLFSVSAIRYNLQNRKI